MSDRIKILEEKLRLQEKELEYYKRLLEDISNKNLRALEEVSKVTNLLKEKEKFQEKLQRAKRMESIGLMAGGVAHDLNNLLSGIVTYPELLLLNLSEDNPLRLPLTKIREFGLRAAEVVADLLTVARGVASTRETHDLGKITNSYLHSPQYENIVSNHPDIDWQIQLSQLPLNISCSEIHVTKCIMNLVTNAAESIDNRGAIEISTFTKTIDSETQALRAEKYAVLQVKDNGHGIDNEAIAQIFEPFYTKKVLGRSGTGLGLSVVWNTMEDHNGFVEVISDETGSSFILFFPLSEKKLKKTNLSCSKGDFHGDESVLIADDEPLQREITTKMLTFLGYQVTAVTSGEDAVDYLRSNSVDILVLDMILGSGMNGFETYKAILKLHPNQKALIASGYSESKDIERTCKLGAGGFIKKPFTMDDMGKALKMILAGNEDSF